MDPFKRQFLKDCVKYIRGDIKEIRLKGQKKTIKLFAEALKESRNLYSVLNSDNEMSDVIPVLESKKFATSRLRKATGFVWPF
jgi:hypothetical protein